MMAIDTLPGDREIELKFVTPTENVIGRVVSAITLLAVAGLMVWSLRRERAT
jgi:hypothetical protein